MTIWGFLYTVGALTVICTTLTFIVRPKQPLAPARARLLLILRLVALALGFAAILVALVAS